MDMTLIKKLAALVCGIIRSRHGDVSTMDPVEQFRFAQVLPYIQGNLLDIGCGYNNLVRQYGQGIGVDVHPWPGVDVLIDDSARLPFPNDAFDTISIIAALNHIPNRDAMLGEVRRMLRDNGHLVLTMIGPLTGYLAHIIFRQDEQLRGRMEGELKGMSSNQITDLLSRAGFEIIVHKRFELGLNHLYVACRRDREETI